MAPIVFVVNPTFSVDVAELVKIGGFMYHYLLQKELKEKTSCGCNEEGKICEVDFCISFERKSTVTTITSHRKPYISVYLTQQVENRGWRRVKTDKIPLDATENAEWKPTSLEFKGKCYASMVEFIF